MTIIGLTVGFTVFVIISLFVYGELTIDRYLPDAERIYRLTDAKENNCKLDFELAQVIKDHFKEVEVNCTVIRMVHSLNIKNKNNTFKINAFISTTNDFFEILSPKITHKTSSDPFADKNSVIITETVAKQLFGEQNPLGKSIKIADRFDLTISAIISDFPNSSSMAADILVNAENKNLRFSLYCNGDDCFSPVNHFIKLKADKSQFIAALNNDVHKYQKRVEKFSLQPLTDIYLAENVEGNTNKLGNPTFLKVISLIGIIIFLLSIINFIFFSLSIQHSRIKEISIKKTNGASLFQLFNYFLTETTIIIFFVSVLSLSLVIIFPDYVSVLFAKKLDLNNLTKPALLLLFAIIIILIILINSVMPIFTMFKNPILDGLNNLVIRKDKKTIKSILTTFQFVVSIILLISVFFIIKQLKYIGSQDLGFKYQHLLEIEIPENFTNYDALKQEISKLNFVKSSTFSYGSISSPKLSLGSGDDKKQFFLTTFSVDSNYLRTFEIELLKGRFYIDGNNDDVCILNETAFKKFGWTDLKGKIFNNGRKDGFKVVGIVKDFKVSSFHSEQKAVCLVFSKFGKPNALSIRLMPGQTKSQVAEIEKVWGEVATNDNFSFKFYDAFFDSLYKKEQILAKSIIFLTLITFLLTLTGILGQVIQNNIYRTKEIGIRKVNGATVFEIIKMLNREFVFQVLIAFVIALPIAYYAINKWLENFVYRTDLSWWVFVLSGSITLFIVAATVSIQSLNVARKNPVESLKYE